MAYWGYQPEGSDTAHNHFTVVTKAAQNVLKAYFTSHVNPLGAWANIGVLQICLEAGFPVSVEILEFAKNTLENLVKDKEFINEFDEPGLIRETLKETSIVIDKLIGENADIDKRDRILMVDLGRRTLFDTNWLNQMEAARGEDWTSKKVK